MTSVPKDFGGKAAAKKNKTGFFRQLGKQWQLALMSVPMLLYVFLFNYFPLWGWRNAFLDIANEHKMKLVVATKR